MKILYGFIFLVLSSAVFSEDLYPFLSETVYTVSEEETGHLQGYIDGEGNIKIPPMYLDRRNNFITWALFKNGSAIVLDTDRTRLCINQDNEIIVDFGDYVFVEVDQDDEIIIAYRDPQSEIKEIKQFTGELLFTIDKEISFFRFSEGYFIASQRIDNPDIFSYSDQRGYLDIQGNLVIPFQYDEAYDFHNGRALVRKDERYFFIDSSGRQLFDQTWELAKGFENNYATVFDGSKWGAINTDGELVVDYIYDLPIEFSEDIALVAQHKDQSFFSPFLKYHYGDTLGYNYFYIDTYGNIILDLHEYGYVYGQSFSEGVAWVYLEDYSAICINSVNEQVVPGRYYLPDIFRNGLALVNLSLRPDGNYELHPIGAHPVYINHKGEIVSDYYRDE